MSNKKSLNISEQASNIKQSAVLIAPLKSDKTVSIPFRLDVSLIQDESKIHPLSHSKPNFFAETDLFGCVFNDVGADKVGRQVLDRDRDESSAYHPIGQGSDLTIDSEPVKYSKTRKGDDLHYITKHITKSIGDSGPIPLGCSTFRCGLSVSHAFILVSLGDVGSMNKRKVNAFSVFTSKRITTKVIVASVSVPWRPSFACVKELIDRVNAEHQLIKRLCRKQSGAAEPLRRNSSEKTYSEGSHVGSFLFASSWVNLCPKSELKDI